MGQRKMRAVFQAVQVIHRCVQSLKVAKQASISSLSIRALSGELLNSPVVEDVFAAVRALDSDALKDFLAGLPDSVTGDSRLQEVQNDLESLTQTYRSTEPLRSEYDHRNSVVKSTVVQQRVRLSKGRAKQPQQNIEYTKIIDRLHVVLESYLAEILVKPQDLFLHEVFLFDMKNPLKETFGPRPRFAVERALSSPFDYLISTSETSGARISTKQPATAILYQLYLESGALVNVHDLWHAFYAVFESDEGEACDEQMIMALFYRALSELKAFGMVKSSRRNVDHVAKSAWFGL
ncbi:Origin recognition complex subunit [Aspergillus sp. HF37]|nr:Origin recognition complex subunit [Aspergillus sp. HF37]